MGNSSSQTIKSTLTDIQNNMVSVQNATNQASSQSCLASATYNVNLTNSTIDCGQTNFGQVVSSSCDLTSQLSSTNTNDLVAQLSNAVSQAAASGQASTIGFLSTNVSVQNSNTSLSQYIQDSMSTYVSDTTFQSCSQNSVDTANFTMNIVNTTIEGNQCNFTQNLVLAAQAMCVVNAVANQALTDTLVASAVQSATASQTNSQGGLTGLVSAVFNGETLLIVGLVAVVLFALVFLGKGLLGGGKKPNVKVK